MTKIPSASDIAALGPVPKDLGGFQQLVMGTVQLGDLFICGPAGARCRTWAYSSIGDSVEHLSSRGWTIYRRMPVAKHVPDEATQKVINSAKALLAEAKATPAPTRTLIPQDDARRKGAPMYRGLIGYFPAALFAVAEHSRESNDKHNPGQELQWARNKSSDHADCIQRHLVDSGTKGTPDRKYHLRALAWRALALLQEECEAEGAAPGISSKF